MADLDRYPTWILLLVAVAAAISVVARWMYLDRGSNPRRLWLMLLGAWLAVIALAWAGLLVTRNGEKITPDEGLLVLADLMAGLLVASVPVGRTMRRMADDLGQPRAGAALVGFYRGWRILAVAALTVGTMAALLTAEIALAGEPPEPPAVVACQDFTTWSLANPTMPPRADQAILAQAASVAQAGRLRLDLQALDSDVQSSIYNSGTAQIVDEARIASDEGALGQDCTAAPAAG
ncbi:MAG TPA: hypothetical protein VMF87_21320 [Streptosporangiaceae bacterium]|nr:hypothetical protein [Streptosporangiaceae bacterium]